MTGERKALIVASDEYDDEALQDLAAPAADAEALGRVLGDRLIGDFAVQVVRNEPAHVIQTHLEELFASSRADDVVLLHFSGHGLKSESGELFFAASNTRPSRLGSTAVSADFVQRCMRASRARSIVLLLDCCYGGAFAQGVRVRATGDVNVLDSFPQENAGGGRGRAVITASGAMEYAFEGERLADDRRPRPSVFTSALVEGLATGEADRDEDGWVSLSELYDYVFDKVREQNPLQTPSRQVELSGELYLARSRRLRIRPAPIPPGLQTAIIDSNMYTRLGAVSELRSRLDSDNLPVAAGAYESLAELARSDIKYVADRAAAAVSHAALHPEETELHFGRIRQGSAALHRTLRLLGPPIARACAPRASETWIVVGEAAEGFDISVDTANAGVLRGTLSLSGPTGEVVVTIDVEILPAQAKQHSRQQAPDATVRQADEHVRLPTGAASLTTASADASSGATPGLASAVATPIGAIPESPGIPSRTIEGGPRESVPAEAGGAAVARLAPVADQAKPDREPTRVTAFSGRPRRRKTLVIGVSICAALLVGSGAAAVVLHSAGRPPMTPKLITPFPPIPGSLNAVAMASPTSAWAVGQHCISHCNTVYSIGRAIILRWSGRQWSKVSSPNIGHSTWLRAVSAKQGSTVWAVGESCAARCGTKYQETRALIFRWNGSAWTKAASPSPGTSARLRAVSVAADGQGWAVGDFSNSVPGTTPTTTGTLILHWDGSTWKQIPSPSPGPSATLLAVSADPQGGAWAVGNTCVPACFTSYETDRPLILHWNGKSWSRIPSPDPAGNSALRSVSIARASSVWAVGRSCVSGCYTTSPTYQTLTMRWDGGRWSQVPSPSPGSSWLRGVVASTGADVWAVGGTCVSDCHTALERDHALIMKWDGSVWTTVANPGNLGNGTIAYSVTSAPPGFIVGGRCVSDCFTKSERYQTLILRWNGTALVRG